MELTVFPTESVAWRVTVPRPRALAAGVMERFVGFIVAEANAVAGGVVML